MPGRDPLAAFHPLVRAWFAERVGEPTAVQAAAWARIAAGEHVLATAPTGSGKTLGAGVGGRFQGGIGVFALSGGAGPGHAAIEVNNLHGSGVSLRAHPKSGDEKTDGTSTGRACGSIG